VIPEIFNPARRAVNHQDFASGVAVQPGPRPGRRLRTLPGC
jgi:hypothetical protein